MQERGGCFDFYSAVRERKEGRREEIDFYRETEGGPESVVPVQPPDYNLSGCEVSHSLSRRSWRAGRCEAALHHRISSLRPWTNPSPRTRTGRRSATHVTFWNPLVTCATPVIRRTMAGDLPSTVEVSTFFPCIIPL